MVQIKIKMVQNLGDEKKKEFKSRVLKEYGSEERLRKKATRGGCQNPDMIDKYKILQALENGADFRKERVISSSDSVSCLTDSRMEILEFLHDHDVDSINELAGALDRDYKNVYDDVKRLSEEELIELDKGGRSRKPVFSADKLIVDFL